MLSTKEFVGRLFMNTSKCLRFCFLLGAVLVVSQLFSGLSPAGSTTSKEDSQKPSNERQLFIFARFHALLGQEKGVEDALRKIVAPTRQQEPGCLEIHIFRSIKDARLFYIHSRWVDEAAFDHHISQPYIKQFAEEVEPLVDHKLDTTRATVIE
jgi:quinol monooxygenase YgiN